MPALPALLAHQLHAHGQQTWAITQLKCTQALGEPTAPIQEAIQLAGGHSTRPCALCSTEGQGVKVTRLATINTKLRMTQALQPTQLPYMEHGS